jgi:hypothetical protein
VIVQQTKPLSAGHFVLPSNGPRDSRSKSQRGDATDSEQSPTRILVVEDDFLIAMQTETA